MTTAMNFLPSRSRYHFLVLTFFVLNVFYISACGKSRDPKAPIQVTQAKPEEKPEEKPKTNEGLKVSNNECNDPIVRPASARTITFDEMVTGKSGGYKLKSVTVYALLNEKATSKSHSFAMRALDISKSKEDPAQATANTELLCSDLKPQDGSVLSFKASGSAPIQIDSLDGKLDKLFSLLGEVSSKEEAKITFKLTESPTQYLLKPKPSEPVDPEDGSVYATESGINIQARFKSTNEAGDEMTIKVLMTYEQTE